MVSIGYVLAQYDSHKNSLLPCDLILMWSNSHVIFQEKAPHNVSMADVAKILLLSAAIFLVQSVLGKSIYIYMCVPKELKYF